MSIIWGIVYGSISNNMCFVPDVILHEPLESREVNFSTIYKESKCCVPISIIVFDTSDPTQGIFELAVSMVNKTSIFMEIP